MASLSLGHTLTVTQPASQRCISLIGWGGALGAGAAMWWMLFSLV